MSEGWVMLHREMLDSKLWSCSDATLRVAVYLILSANHKERYHRRITIKRGQCVRSITMISDACGLTRKTVRTALKNLTDDGFVVIDEPFGAQQGHRLTICKYGTYQGDAVESGTARAHAVPHEVSNELPLGLPTNNNDKNEKNVKTKVVYPPDFEELWKAYPKKKSKGTALDAWNETKSIRPGQETILAVVKLLAKTKSWTEDGGQWVPNGATWLRAHGWNDEAGEPAYRPANFNEDGSAKGVY
jgi:hypothetical protein